MTYLEHRPPMALQRAVECIWTLESEGPGAGFQTIVPDGCAELIIQLGDAFEHIDDGQVRRQPPALLAGPQSVPLLVRPTGRGHTIGIRFRPGGLSCFLAGPVHELRDRLVAADVVFGRLAGELSERVADARGGAQMLVVVETMLLPLARKPAAARLIETLIRHRGGCSIDRLAAGAGLTTRQVERMFRSEVGLTPKRLGRILRLHEVLRRTAMAPSCWIDVALDCGYADQAHLCREFRELTGETPTAWESSDAALLARCFTRPERLDAFFGG